MGDREQPGTEVGLVPLELPDLAHHRHEDVRRCVLRFGRAVCPQVADDEGCDVTVDALDRGVVAGLGSEEHVGEGGADQAIHRRNATLVHSSRRSHRESNFSGPPQHGNRARIVS